MRSIVAFIRVDDVAFMRNIAVRALNQAGFVAVPAEHAAAAQMALRKEPEIAAVVTDLEMPKMNGNELFEACKATLGDDTPPFVLLTASNSVEAMVQAKRQGFADVQTKPLDIDRLLKSLQAVIPQELMDQISVQSSNEPAEETSVASEEDSAAEPEAEAAEAEADAPTPVAESEEEPQT